MQYAKNRAMEWKEAQQAFFLIFHLSPTFIFQSSFTPILHKTLADLDDQRCCWNDASHSYKFVSFQEKYNSGILNKNIEYNSAFETKETKALN